MKSKVFRWLHFSDIHVGVAGLSQLWPRFGAVLLDDLERLLPKVGPVDFIVFSGDFVQKGAPEEFTKFDEILLDILDLIGRYQARPKIITTPGNHDLVRPGALSPVAVALRQYWHDKALREAFWTDAGDDYRALISETFSNYIVWRERAISNEIHVKPDSTGILPGDASYTFQREDAGKIGIAALNSTWLQLTGGDYLGQLHVDARQLLSITKERPDDWVRENDANILLTHQPAEWLHSNSPSTWENDINPPGRFDLHLFGHMHEPRTLATKHGGGLGRRDVQAASLFGLESYGDGQHTRIQGYSANQIAIGQLDRQFICWPRRLIPVAGGKMKLVPDNGQDLNEETGSFEISYSVERRTELALSGPDTTESETSRVTLSPAAFDLSAIRQTPGETKAHRGVRRVEQETAIASLKQDRIIWLLSDWGMGEDGFISSICGQLEVSGDCVSALDFSQYTDRTRFFDELRIRFSASFQQVCETIADSGRSVLIFDDIDISTSGKGNSNFENELEDLARTLADFASDTFVIMRSRRAPRTATFRVIGLGALDEADVAIYARESDLGGERFGKPDAASILFRHTDGVPTRIDAALRDLEIISLRDLISSNADYGDTGATIVAAPRALVDTMHELQRSEDRADQRAYNLLLALSALPQGEQLSRIKRFLGPHPFGPIHARALLERSLIDTVTLTTLESMPEDFANKALVVPRPVRDFVRDTIDEETSKSIDRKALDLYFGEDWTSGDIRNSQTGKRVRQALCDGYEIQNANTLILRSVRQSLQSKVRSDAEAALRLAAAFIDALTAGDHFRSCASLCEDLIQMLDDYDTFEKERVSFKCDYAASLRMTGRLSEARSIFESLDHSLLSKRQRQGAELGLALCLDRQGEAAAVDAAKRVIAIDKTTGAAIQARVIIAEQLDDPEARSAELNRLLRAAQKNDNTTLANNIMLTLAKESKPGDPDSEDKLRIVLKTARSKGDFYNAARAIVDLASRPGAEKRLTSVEKHRLIETYHFLYNERLYSLFDRSHAALWKVFDYAGDRANLLNLFRHSSFIWRLNGREDQERKYLSKLAKNMRELIFGDLTEATRDGAYFAVRVTVVLGVSFSESQE